MELQKEPSYQRNSGIQTARKSVLVVDDNADLLNLFKTILELDDYEVFTANSAQDAFRILSEINKPNLIFLDVKMQDMDGPEFLLMLEEKMPELVNNVPVVFLTGMDQVPKSKAVGFICKPIAGVDLFLNDTRRFIELGMNKLNYEH
jgi:CheY-like chemotaxis protein